jgi:hypothetical protein
MSTIFVSVARRLNNAMGKLPKARKKLINPKQKKEENHPSPSLPSLTISELRP